MWPRPREDKYITQDHQAHKQQGTEAKPGSSTQSHTVPRGRTASWHGCLHGHLALQLSCLRLPAALDRKPEGLCLVHPQRKKQQEEHRALAPQRGHRHLVNAIEFFMSHQMAPSKGVIVVPRDTSSLTNFPPSLELLPPLERSQSFRNRTPAQDHYGSVHTFSRHVVLAARRTQPHRSTPEGPIPLCLSGHHLFYKARPASGSFV